MRIYALSNSTFQLLFQKCKTPASIIADISQWKMKNKSCKWEIKATEIFLMNVSAIYEHVYLFSVTILISALLCQNVENLAVLSCFNSNVFQTYQKNISTYTEDLPCTLSYRCLLGK